MISCGKYPSSEVIILGNFNVHNEAWLKSDNNSIEDRDMQASVISYDLSQLFTANKLFPRVGNSIPSILYLFIKTYRQSHAIDVSFRLVSSG